MPLFSYTKNIIKIYNTYFFQNISTWVDGSPVKHFEWIARGDYLLLNYTIVQLSNGKNFTSSPSHYLEFHDRSLRNKRPHTWCTGLVFTAHGEPLGMIRVICDLKINASFFCQEITAHHLFSPHTLGMPYTFVHNYWMITECESGWARIDDFCFLMIEKNKEISWEESKQMCHNFQNASLLNITNTSDEPEYVMNAENMKDGLLFLAQGARNTKIGGISDHYISGLIKQLSLMTNEIYSTFLELQPLQNINKKLLNIIDKITKTIRIFVQDCFFVKNHRLLKEGHAITKTACSQNRNITHLLCQKGVSMKTSSCNSLYYTCMDGTCILQDYRCDGNNDCYQGDDELNCKVIQYLSAEKLKYLENNSWWLSFSICLHLYPGYIAASKRSCVMVHSLCDNIHDIAVENTFCQYIAMREQRVHTLSKTNEDNLLFAEYFNSMCMHGLNRVRYSQDDKLLGVESCDMIECPFMFRCENSYCINIENVCDGRSDCPYQSDEILCENTTCPGMLKCRGEKRCLPDYLICNTRVDCIYSADDELGCQSCPDKCNCSGYTIICFDRPAGTYSLFYKAVFFKYSIKTLQGLSWTEKAIFLDLSYCNIINLQNNVSSHAILIINISNNMVSSLEFKHFQQLHNLHTLDASHNNIKNLFIEHEKSLRSAVYEQNNNKLILVALFVSSNKITVLHKTIFEALQHLEFINIEENPLEFVQSTIFISKINIRIILLSDIAICCLNIASKAKCFVNDVDIIYERHCTIHTGVYLKIMWDALAAGGLICSICVGVFQWYRTKKAAHLDIVSMNHIFCCILLFGSMIITVHIPTPRYNLNISTHLTWLHAIMDILSFLLVVISSLLTIMRYACLILKTFFPFRHQCRWLKVVPLLSFITWILAAAGGWVDISFKEQQNVIKVTNARQKNVLPPYTITLLCLNVVLIFMTSLCYKVLLSINSSDVRKHQTSLKRTFTIKVHGNYFCQLLLIIVGSCILIVFVSDLVSSETLYLMLPCFYYVSALRAFITVGGSVLINVIFSVLK